MFESFETPVQCDQGHLYTTIWVPFVSLKSVRLGDLRLQRCPVGKHWSRTRRLDRATLSPERAGQAAAVHDVRLP